MNSRDNNPVFGLLVLMLSTMLVSCAIKDSAPENADLDWRKIKDAVPKYEPFSRYGNPDSYEVFGQQYQVMEDNTGFTEKGIASWYGTKFHGERTSSGEEYDMYAMTAAHKSLRIPTYVEVTNLANKRKAIVKVNDRGPFHEGRVIDLSYAAATRLGVAETGTAPVSIRVIDTKNPLDETDVVIGDLMAGSDLATAELAVDEQKGEQFYVQVAALSSEENAFRLMNELKEKEFRSVRIHVDNDEEPEDALYRVRIGPVPSLLIAEKLISQLKEINHNNVRIVAYK